MAPLCPRLSPDPKTCVQPEDPICVTLADTIHSGVRPELQMADIPAGPLSDTALDHSKPQGTILHS